MDTQRFHYMDNLRALAMIGGVLFHAALAYSPMTDGLWLTADSEQSAIVDIIVWFSHLFRMPLFFIVAGFFAALIVSKYGFWGLSKNRCKRILLPFVLFLPLLWYVNESLFSYALENVENKSPLLSFLHGMLANGNAMPEMPPRTSHLWFLYNLLLMYIFVLVFASFELEGVVDKIRRVPTKFLVFLVPGILVPALMLVPAPQPAPESFMPELWSLGFYGLFFAFGYLVFLMPELMDRIAQYSWQMLIIAILSYVAYYFYLPEKLSFMSPAQSVGDKIILSFTGAYTAAYMSLLCLIWGKRLLNFQNSLLRLFSDSSYWIYLVHLPLITFIQIYLMDMQWSLTIEFMITVLGTMLLSIISYFVLVRWTPLAGILGKSQKARTVNAQTATT